MLEDDKNKLKLPLYIKGELLSKCLHGKTRNANEGFFYAFFEWCDMGLNAQNGFV